MEQIVLEHWLIMSNCQSFGLAACFNLLNPDITVTPCDPRDFRENMAHWTARLPEVDRVIVSHELEAMGGADFAGVRHLSRLQPLSFAAFHPDQTYLFVGGQPVVGPLDAYHSMIVYAAFSKGYGLDATRALFNWRIFEACGYLTRWVPERDAAIANFSANGVDISHAIRRWGRHASFMYSTNHPKIDCIYDIARLYLLAAGYPVEDACFRPHDNLANGPAFPVYPEIGDALGVPGEYIFKRLSQYRHIGLDQFIAESFAAYEGLDLTAVVIETGMRATFDRVMALL